MRLNVEPHEVFPYTQPHLLTQALHGMDSPEIYVQFLSLPLSLRVDEYITRTK